MKINRKIYFLITIDIVAISLLFIYKTSTNPIINVGDTKISVEVVKSSTLLQKGLSDRDPLDPNKGMLFVMPRKNMYTFWMKDMRFPIDIIWITHGRVLSINANIPIELNNDNLELYQSPSPIDYVLEVNAGFTASHHIQIGDPVTGLY